MLKLVSTHSCQVDMGPGCAGLGLAWAVLDWAGLDWAVLGFAGLGWAGFYWFRGIVVVGACVCVYTQPKNPTWPHLTLLLYMRCSSPWLNWAGLGSTWLGWIWVGLCWAKLCCARLPTTTRPLHSSLGHSKGHSLVTFLGRHERRVTQRVTCGSLLGGC